MKKLKRRINSSFFMSNYLHLFVLELSLLEVLFDFLEFVFLEFVLLAIS